MSKYYYPAIFEYDEKEEVYIVNFPDLDGCFTDGKTIKEATENAVDALSLMLWHLEEEKRTIPQATEPYSLKIKIAGKSFISMVQADTKEYKRKMNKKTVKKTLTIPEWLNTLAIENNVNFSGVLQDALKTKLNA